MRLLCFLGFHRRSKSRARWEGKERLSVCSRCGTPMRKQANGRWTVADPG